MNRNYLDGFVTGVGASALLHGLATGGLRESMLAATSLVFYEAGKLAIELHNDAQERRYIGKMIRDGIYPIEITKRLT